MVFVSIFHWAHSTGRFSLHCVNVDELPAAAQISQLWCSFNCCLIYFYAKSFRVNQVDFDVTLVCTQIWTWANKALLKFTRAATSSAFEVWKGECISQSVTDELGRLQVKSVWHRSVFMVAPPTGSASSVTRPRRRVKLVNGPLSLLAWLKAVAVYFSVISWWFTRLSGFERILSDMHLFKLRMRKQDKRLLV